MRGDLRDRDVVSVVASLPLQMLTLLLAVLALLIFSLTDADGGRSSQSLWFWNSIETAATVIAAWLIRVRMQRAARREPRPPGAIGGEGNHTASSMRQRVVPQRQSVMVMPLLLVVFVLSLLWEPVQRAVIPAGRPFEMMMMHSQKNLMLAAAAFGCLASCQRLVVVIGTVLSTFCAAVTGDDRVLWLIAIFGFVAVSWLVASYWDTLRARLLPGEARRLPWRWLIIGPAIPLVLLLGSATGGHSAIRAIKGFLPSSGGTGEYDEFSRGGVNDGDALVAGTDNIKSFGPIEDSPFAESDKPSLYDVINDTFDEPVRKIRAAEKAISLPPELLADIQARMAKSQQVGREFSTLRKTTPPDRKAIRDLNSNALFYVAGRVPLHLRMQIYDVFDGDTWYPEIGEPEWSAGTMAMTDSGGKPWLRIPCQGRGLKLHTHQEQHAIKPINLKSPVIPAPIDVRGIHIDLVDRRDMFKWHCDSIVQLDRETMPEMVPIHLKSEVADLSLLPDHEDLTFAAMSAIRRTQLPDTDSIARIRALAEDWTREIPREYLKIAEISERLKRDYTIERELSADKSDGTTVEQFLFETRRGPEYQFATACALMLRSLGYSTRLLSGFYARPDKFDAKHGQTPVDAEDAHFWCEVFIGAGTWITVDPSPGYEILAPPPGLWQRFTTQLSAFARTAARHWIVSSVLMVVSGLLLWHRRRVEDFVRSAWWRLMPASTPRECVIQTRQLLDHRLRLLNRARPANATFSRWIRMQSEASFATDEVREFLELSDRAAFAPDVVWKSSSGDEVHRCCVAAGDVLSFQRVCDARKVLTQVSPLGLSQWFNGLCATVSRYSKASGGRRSGSE